MFNLLPGNETLRWDQADFRDFVVGNVNFYRIWSSALFILGGRIF